jgi:hypothetical protein
MTPDTMNHLAGSDIALVSYLRDSGELSRYVDDGVLARIAHTIMRRIKNVTIPCKSTITPRWRERI